MKKRHLKLIALFSLFGMVLCACANQQPIVEDGYTVKFETNGGTPIDDYKNVKIIETSPVTTRDGYKFTSWYKNQSLLTRATFPLTVSSDMTLYAKWEKQEVVPEGTLVASSQTALGTAKAYMSAEYKSDCLSVTINVSDKNIYSSYTNDNGELNGMNDNVELYVSPVSHQPTGLLSNKTYKVMVVPKVGYEVRRFVYYNNTVAVNERYVFSNPLDTGISVTTKINNINDDGYSGYSCVINIPFSLFSLNETTAIKNMAIYLAMRNTDANTLTTYTESSFLYSERKNAWSHFLVDENNEFCARNVDTIIFGDNYVDSDYYLSINEDFAEKEIYGTGISGSKAIEWNNNDSYFERLAIHHPRCLIMHLGMYDVNSGDKTGVASFNSLKALIGKIHGTMPECEIYWMTLTNTFVKAYFIDGVNKFEAAYNQVNLSMKEYAQELTYLHIIDYASVAGNDITLFASDGLSPNALACNLMSKVILDALNVPQNSGTVFGSVNNLASSTGFDLAQEDSGLITNSGNYDQYAICKQPLENTFTFSCSLKAKTVHNGDAYPKMGLVLKNGKRILFLYIDMGSQLKGTNVGYVFYENIGSNDGCEFNWNTAMTYNLSTIKYTGDNKAALSIKKTSDEYKLFANDVNIFNFELDEMENVTNYVGVLSFNTAIEVTDFSLTD